MVASKLIALWVGRAADPDDRFDVVVRKSHAVIMQHADEIKKARDAGHSLTEVEREVLRVVEVEMPDPTNPRVYYNWLISLG